MGDEGDVYGERQLDRGDDSQPMRRTPRRMVSAISLEHENEKAISLSAAARANQSHFDFRVVAGDGPFALPSSSPLQSVRPMGKGGSASKGDRSGVGDSLVTTKDPDVKLIHSTIFETFRRSREHPMLPIRPGETGPTIDSEDEDEAEEQLAAAAAEEAANTKEGRGVGGDVETNPVSIRIPNLTIQLPLLTISHFSTLGFEQETSIWRKQEWAAVKANGRRSRREQNRQLRRLCGLHERLRFMMARDPSLAESVAMAELEERAAADAAMSGSLSGSSKSKLQQAAGDWRDASGVSHAHAGHRGGGVTTDHLWAFDELHSRARAVARRASDIAAHDRHYALASRMDSAGAALTGIRALPTPSSYDDFEPNALNVISNRLLFQMRPTLETVEAPAVYPLDRPKVIQKKKDEKEKETTIISKEEVQKRKQKHEEEEDDGAIEARWLPRLKKIDPNIVEEEEEEEVGPSLDGPRAPWQPQSGPIGAPKMLSGLETTMRQNAAPGKGGLLDERGRVAQAEEVDGVMSLLLGPFSRDANRQLKPRPPPPEVGSVEAKAAEQRRKSRQKRKTMEANRKRHSSSRSSASLSATERPSTRTALSVGSTVSFDDRDEGKEEDEERNVEEEEGKDRTEEANDDEEASYEDEEDILKRAPDTPLGWRHILKHPLKVSTTTTTTTTTNPPPTDTSDSSASFGRTSDGGATYGFQLQEEFGLGLTLQREVEEFHASVRYGRLAAVKAAIGRHGVDILNRVDADTGNTALHVATQNDQPALVKAILSLRGKRDAATGRLYDVAVVAAPSLREQMVRRDRQKRKQTVTTKASSLEDLEAAPTRFSARRSILSQLAASVEGQKAAEGGYEDERVVDCDAQNLAGNTALHMAVEYGLAECTEFLCELGGADQTIRNQSGFLAIRGISGGLEKKDHKKRLLPRGTSFADGVMGLTKKLSSTQGSSFVMQLRREEAEKEEAAAAGLGRAAPRPKSRTTKTKGAGRGFQV